MFRLTVAAFFLVGITLASLSAQDFQPGDKKFEDPPKTKDSTGIKTTNPNKGDPVPGDCEIQFLNGSKIRLIVQTEKLEITTIYGNLAVPIEDVLAIEFGLHFP